MKRLILGSVLALLLCFGVKAELSSQEQKWYEEFNQRYFDSKLPTDVVIDDADYDIHRLASTFRMKDGRFHIAFNLYFTHSERVKRTALLHEMCHVKEFSEFDGPPYHEHGARWRTCMLAIDAADAFRNELIDGYENQ